MRRRVDELGFVHGANGYRMSCRCPTCTEGHRLRRARYVAGKRGEFPEEAVPLEDDGMPPGALEAAVAAEIAELGVVVRERPTLAAQALVGARIADRATAEGRYRAQIDGIKIVTVAMDRLKALAH